MYWTLSNIKTLAQNIEKVPKILFRSKYHYFDPTKKFKCVSKNFGHSISESVWNYQKSHNRVQIN